MELQRRWMLVSQMESFLCSYALPCQSRSFVLFSIEYLPYLPVFDHDDSWAFFTMSRDAQQGDRIKVDDEKGRD